VPGVNAVVWIQAGHEVTYDLVSDVALAAVGVEGALRFRTDVSTRLKVGTLLVAPAGTLEIGTQATPVSPAVTAELIIADRPLAPTSPDPDTGVVDPKQYGTALIGLGRVTIHGAVKTPTFARLAQEPAAANTTLTVAEPVTGWRAGDTLVLPDTRHLTESQWRAYVPDSGDGQAGLEKYKPYVAELALQSHAEGTASLPVQFLRYPDGTAFNPANHKGARDGAGVVRFLPHVGNLTRNVVIRSENPSGTRGHILFLNRADVDIRYARFVEMGRTKIVMTREGFTDNTDPVTNHIGRYGLHFHHVHGLFPPAHPYQFTLLGNAFEGAIKWAVTIHNTHFGLVRDNVIYRTGGAGLYTEDGPEYGNTIERNFVVFVKGGTFDAKSNCVGKCLSDIGDLGDGLWFRGPMNIVRDNVVADVLRTGYIVFAAERKREDPNAVFDGDFLVVNIPNFPGADTHMAAERQKVNVGCRTYLEFARNEVYGVTKVGFSFWSVGELEADCSYSGPLQRNLVKDFRGWHLHGDGSWVYYVSDLTVNGWMQLGNPNVSNENSVGIHWSRTQRLTVRNADIQGEYYGIVNRGRGDSELFIVENAYLKNRVNVRIRPWTQHPPSGKRETFLHNVTFEPQPNSPAQHAIVMDWNPPSGANTSVPDRAYAHNYNRQPELDFRVFYPEQQGNGSIAGGNAGICPATRPEIEGFVCPTTTPPPSAYGDVDGSGVVTLADLRELLRILTGQAAPVLERADLTGDGKVSLGDARELVQLLVQP
jgi:hypothetical protein